MGNMGQLGAARRIQGMVALGEGMVSRFFVGFGAGLTSCMPPTSVGG